MEQNGSTYTGSTTYKTLFKSSLTPEDTIACFLKGGSAASYPMGAAMIDDTANPGCKKRYTNTPDSSIPDTTGACILMTEEATTVAGKNVEATACRDGALVGSMVVDANGDPVDDYFKAALPKVVFES
jgi:hypothetical protein